MSLAKHSLATANSMKKILDARPRNTEIVIAKVVQNSIENWVTRLTGNKLEYPRMRVGILGADADTIEILIQCGMDVLHSVGQKEFKWFYSDDKPDLPLINSFEIGCPYYPAFSMDSKERKGLYEDNLIDLLLGNPVFHPSAFKSCDLLAGIGSIVGPFSWVAPGVGIGKMVTVGAHVAIASDVVIGDYSHIEQNVSIQSGVRIGEGCRIGAGTIIFPGVKIAPFTILNAGQIVKYNIGVK